ncbi:MAG: ATP-binding protein [Polyangiaceae bacterium]
MVEKTARRRTVAARLLATYVVVVAAFAVTVGWSVLALRAAARDAEVLRAGYVPLLVRIGEALAEQNVVSAQLNHITSAKNPGDVKEWLSASRRARPLTFASLRDTAENGLGAASEPGVRALGEEAAKEIAAIDKLLSADPERFQRLFSSLAAGETEQAERARSEILKREAEGALRLRALKARVEERMAQLTAEAKGRELQSMRYLISLGALTLAVGLAMFLYARRVLSPLTKVTERVRAVGQGDLTPREVVATKDEIGELALSFESMVAAIQRARSELVQAERLATIGKMAAHITHEIRNPLSSIGLNVELLEEEIAGQEGAESTALVTAIKAEVDRLSRIAEQYLSVARRPRPHFARERLDDLVRELLAFVQPELARAKVRADIDTDDAASEVELDESQLRQALLNLVRNAREAMPEGGTLSVSVRSIEPAAAEIVIEDEGVGIPEEVIANVFDPFFTTKARGTGLGLAVTREIIEAHGGHITCERRTPRGTRFRIWLPRHQPEPAASEGPSSTEGATSEDP